MQDIIKGCKQKDAQSQRKLFVHFAPYMMTVCRRYTPNSAEAEDILQEAFIKVFRNFDRFDAQKGNIEQWIRRIVIHKAIEFWRKNQRNPFVSTEKMHEEPIFAAEIEEQMDAEAVLHLIATLPERSRIVFNLYAIEGYSHREIAETLNINEGSSRTYLTRARQYLQTQLSSKVLTNSH